MLLQRLWLIMREIAIPGAGAVAAYYYTSNLSPPSGARVSGQILLTQGTYLYSAVGQQPNPAQFSPGKPEPLVIKGLCCPC